LLYSSYFFLVYDFHLTLVFICSIPQLSNYSQTPVVEEVTARPIDEKSTRKRSAEDDHGPPTKRPRGHNDASCHVVVSREFVVVILFISFSHLQFSSHSCIYMFNSNSPTSSQTLAVEHQLPPENEQVDIDFDDIQDRVDDEQEEEQPAPLRRERLPTILEEEEEEEEEEEQSAPLRHERLPTILEEEEEEEEVEEQPAPLRHERLPTILEEEEEEVEAQPVPAVRRHRHKREVASLLTELGGYWKSPECGRRRSCRARRKPQRYVP